MLGEKVYKFPDAVAWPMKPVVDALRAAGVPRYWELRTNPVPAAKLAPLVLKKVNTILSKGFPAGVIKFSP